MSKVIEYIEEFLKLPCAIHSDEDIERHKKLRQEIREFLKEREENKEQDK